MAKSCRFAMGVHALGVLAMSPGEWRSSEYLAGSIGTHPVVVRRLVRGLSLGGLVETQKGPHGGVRLAKAPGEIALGEVYQAVETSEPFSLHGAPNPDCPVAQAIGTILGRVFADAEAALVAQLNQTRLCDVWQQVQSHADGRQTTAALLPSCAGNAA